MSFQVRRAEADDLDAILELQTLALGAGSVPRGESFWKWKHTASPFGVSPVWVAEADRNLVGLRVFSRWQFQSGIGITAGITKAVRAVDTATHPDWRRQGVFSRLTEVALEELSREGCSLIFNTPNKRSGAGYRKLGWLAGASPRVHIRVVRPMRLAASLVKPDPKPVPAALEVLPSLAELFDWPELEQLLSRYDSGWGGRLHTALSREWIRWRYLDIPGVEYRCLYASQGDHSMALILRSRVRRSRREVVISECWGAGDMRGQQRLLENLITRLIETVDADYIAASAATKTPLARLFEANRLRRIPWGPHFMVRSLPDAKNTTRYLAADAWQLSLGDLEVF